MRTCSLPCVKAHKANGACDATKAHLVVAQTAEAAASAAIRAAEEDDSLPRLKEEQLAKLQTNESIRAACRDSRLQRVLNDIASSTDPARALAHHKRAHGDDFQRFLDDMLCCVGVCVRRQDGSVDFCG